jgi:hypothetical protein
MTHRASDLDKSALYLNALPAFGSHRVRLLDNKSAVEQFVSLERRPGAGGRDRVDARGGKSEDSANVIAGIISLLAKPLTGPEAFLEFMRRQCVAAGVSLNRVGADMDEVRAAGPEFGFDLNPAPLVAVRVPAPIDTEGSIQINGNLYGFRRVGQDVVVDLRRADAAWLLSRSQPWADLNAEIVAEILNEEDAA